MALLFSLSFASCGGNEGSTKVSSIKSDLKTSEVTRLSVVINPTMEQDVSNEDINGYYMLDLVRDTYSNINVLKFDNTANISGTDDVHFMFTGDSVKNFS